MIYIPPIETRRHGLITYAPAYEHSKELRNLIDDETLSLTSGPDHQEPYTMRPIRKDDSECKKTAILEDNHVAGMIEFGTNEPHTVGFWLGSDFRGRGIMKSVWAHQQYTMLHKGYAMFTAATWEHNKPALNLLKSLGFEERGSMFHERGTAVRFSLVIDREAEIKTLSELIPTIKPIHCPFCGPGMSQTEVYFDWDSTKRWRVACGACGTHSGHSHRDKHPDDVTKRWNTRPLGE